MKRRGFLLLLVVGFLIPVAVDASTLQSTDMHPLASVDFWVDTSDSYRYYWSSLGEDYVIHVDIEVTSGSDIDFYILDEDNYDLWSSGYSSSAEVGRDNAGSVSLSFTVPVSGEWNLLFINDNWLYRKHIEGTITAAAPQVINDSSGLIGAVITAIVLVVIIGCILDYASKHEKRKQQTQQVYQPSYPQAPQYPEYSRAPSPPPAQTGFCPYCGTPKHSIDAQFCSTCGRSFRGSDLG